MTKRVVPLRAIHVPLFVVTLQEFLARDTARQLARRSARQRMRRHQFDQAADAELHRDRFMQTIGEFSL